MKDLLQSRYSVKKFDPEKKLTKEQVDELIDCFRLSPSSLNIQPWKLVVVEDKELKNKLALAGRNDNCQRIQECSHLFILMRKKITFSHIKKVIKSTEILQMLMKKRNISELKLKAFFWVYSFIKGQKAWTTNQLYIALGVLLSSCAKMGIGSLPMEGIKLRKMDRILDISSEYRSVVALAVGYPHKKDETNPSKLKKSRLPRSELVMVF